MEADNERNWSEELSEPEALIIDGHLYVDGGHSTGPRSLLGFGGKLWVIRELSTGYAWRTNNLWDRGQVPDAFARPDTHEFLNPPPGCSEVERSSFLITFPTSSLPRDWR